MRVVFEANVGGFGSYRIPALLRTENDTLLAVCEARQVLGDHEQNKIVLRRSADFGETWSTLCIVADAGMNALNNPLLVQDRVSGDLILMYQEYPFTTPDAVENCDEWVSHEGQSFSPNHHEGAVGEGFEGRICRTFVQRSTDDGRSWSAREDITRQVKRPTGVTCYGGGPGVGIQLAGSAHRNRLVMPFTQGPWGRMTVYAVLSDDSGDTWRYGDVAAAHGDVQANEVQVVELGDGRLMLNARTFGGPGVRKLAYSDDGGATWSSLQDARDLLDPQCQGSTIALPENEGTARLLYCGPRHETERRCGTILQSLDDGASWEPVAVVDEGPFAYSSMCLLPDAQVGVLYERGNYEALTFAVVPLRLSSIPGARGG